MTTNETSGKEPSESATDHHMTTDTGRVFCAGCGMDMWEYSDEAKEDGWCISCAPECYIGGVHVAAKEART